MRHVRELAAASLTFARVDRDEEGVERGEEADGIDDAEVEHLSPVLLNCDDEVADGRQQLDEVQERPRRQSHAHDADSAHCPATLFVGQLDGGVDGEQHRQRLLTEERTGDSFLALAVDILALARR